MIDKGEVQAFVPHGHGGVGVVALFVTRRIGCTGPSGRANKPRLNLRLFYLNTQTSTQSVIAYRTIGPAWSNWVEPQSVTR